ncbi:MAG: hypothetical protein PHN74_03300 [Candidatus Pacebacteria bacterium]|nr:hypothetical protein [Candidatus Paceibacterota bacterium]
MHKFYGLLEKLDHVFALRVTARKWLKPLYQDNSVIGYILGFIFRTIRIFIAFIFYLILAVLALVLFFAWALVPIFIIYKIIINL